jgi:hypothetical protein
MVTPKGLRFANIYVGWKTQGRIVDFEGKNTSILKLNVSSWTGINICLRRLKPGISRQLSVPNGKVIPKLHSKFRSRQVNIQDYSDSFYHPVM